MNGAKYWAFDDHRSRVPGRTVLEEKLEDRFRGWQRTLSKWKVRSERFRLRRNAKGFRNFV